MTTSNHTPEPSDASEVEPGELIREELDRLAHHPREEAARLRAVAEDGESGATPFIMIARVAVRVWPLVLLLLLLVGVVLAVYFHS
jgi:hypothetical protein